MAPARDSDIIYLSDDSEHEVALRSPVTRTKSSRPGNKSSRNTGNRSYANVIDLTADNVQSSANTTVPNRPRARSPAAKRPDLLNTVRTLVSPRLVQKTDESSARSKAASPVVPSSDSDEELPDDPTPKASASRLFSKSKLNGPKPISSSPRKSSLLSSPKKRTRDGDDSTQRPKASGKRRRVATENEDGQPATSFHSDAASRDSDLRRKAHMQTSSSKISRTNSPAGGATTRESSVAGKVGNMVPDDAFQSTPSRRPAGSTAFSNNVTRDSRNDTSRTKSKSKEPRSGTPIAAGISGVRENPSPSGPATIHGQQTSRQTKGSLPSTVVHRGGNLERVEAEQSKASALKVLDQRLKTVAASLDGGSAPVPAEAEGLELPMAQSTEASGKANPPAPASDTLQLKASMLDTASALVEPNVEPKRQRKKKRFFDTDDDSGHTGKLTANEIQKTSQAATPLRRVSNADNASAGASPSSQLQREASKKDPRRSEDEDGEKVPEESARLGEDPDVELPANTISAATVPFVIPDLSMFPVERQVERILGKYYQEMREDTDYFTKAWLKRSRRSIELHVDKQNETSGKTSTASAIFARLRASAVTQPTTASAKIGDGNIKLNVDIYNGSTSKPIRSHLKVKITYCEASSLANDVPEYAHYVSLKSNMLAPNTTTMTVWPYFGDGEPDPEEFEKHYFMDTDQRHRKIRRILEAQKVEEYIESALQDLGISWDDVLRFLLELRPDVGTNAVARAAIKNRDAHAEDFPRVQGRKKWTKVLSSLSSTTTEKLTRAAILCDNFQRMAKFPLWHVARRSATVKKAFEAQEPPPSSIESRTCRVCFQFNCHQHGELRESHSDTDSGVETDDAVAKDVLYPPRVNFRKRVSLPESPTAIQDDEAESGNPASSTRNRKTPKYWDNANFTKPGEWPPFYPCHHPGLTCTQAECSCFVDRRPCEKTCECSRECSRKFQGCSCSQAGKRSGTFVCWRDERCACYMMGRECDADMCGACGVCEVLDPVHRHASAAEAKKRCNNASIQKGVPKHTLLGDSGVHGMGLYAGEPIKKNEFVGEYKGEVITITEADRRGAVYEKQNSTYLFTLNTRQEVDSNFYGNKIRFINHRNGAGANLYPLIVLVNSVHRIGLFAQNYIKPGHELFFDYGPKFPEHLLGGTQQPVSKSAPHARNTNLLNQFYDVQDEEDEDGNVRARKAAESSKRGRPRKAGDPVAKPIKPKGKMGGARPGAGRKPGKKKVGAPDEVRGGGKVAGGEEGEDEVENPRITSQDRFEAYYVSQDKDLGLNGGGDGSDDEDFVGDVASEEESSEEDEFGDDEDESEGAVRGRRARGRPKKYEM